MRKSCKCQGFGMRFLLLAVIAALCMEDAVALIFNSPVRRRGNGMTMYMPSNGPTSQTPSLTAQRMLKNPGNPQVKEISPQSKVQLSHSVLASCDTLPSFPTAHGLLSPETVARMEELTFERGHNNNPALCGFINTYRRQGPLSCLPMLSDPNVLPHLTEAMRDIANL